MDILSSWGAATLVDIVKVSGALVIRFVVKEIVNMVIQNGFV